MMRLTIQGFVAAETLEEDFFFSNGSSSQVLFMYERLGMFFFLCGKLGNT